MIRFFPHTMLGLVVAGGLGLIAPAGTGVEHAAAADAVSSSTLKEQGDSLIKNVEEMVAHGGMGDAKAIVHHCAEATHHAETLKQLSGDDPKARAPLDEVIRQCRRVAQIGEHADPGLLLNPAIKARTAAHESVRALGLKQEKKS